VSCLIQPLPSGTAFCIGVVLLVVMMTGRLVQCKGSLARAVLPFVVHLRWGWHRVERAMVRGQFSLDALFDRAFLWCMATLPVESVRLGREGRELVALDTSTIARWRSGARLALAAKGYWHRVGRAVRANIVAAATSIVLIRGVRVGLVRRVRFGGSCEQAVDTLFAALPPPEGKRLVIVDAGIATHARFAAATAQDVLLGRLRINSKVRHGAVLHPGVETPEVEPAEDFTQPGETGPMRIRRWKALHFEDWRETLIDVLRLDDPAYPRPLLVGTTARELTTQEFLQGYPYRWPVGASSQGRCVPASESPAEGQGQPLVA